MPNGARRRTASLAERPMIFLIGPPVIRIRPKPFRISANSQSNRLKTPTAAIMLHARYGRPLASPSCLRDLCAPLCPLCSAFRAPRLLIGSAVIRIGRRPHGINDLNFSNRHKKPHFGSVFTCPEAYAERVSVHLWMRTALRPTARAPMIFLIGPPVIRIRPKPFRISLNSDSNRRKRRPLRIDQSIVY